MLHKVNVGVEVENPTHDISLTDGVKTVGLIICDSEGNHHPRGIAKKPVDRIAMKTNVGNTKWGDYDYPWGQIAQEDYSNGIGALEYDSEVTKYFWGVRMNTTSVRKVILAPAVRYTWGLRKHITTIKPKVLWDTLTEGSSSYIAAYFTPANDITTSNLFVYVKRIGKPANDLTVEICSDNSGAPSTAIASSAIDVDDVEERISALYKLSVSASLTSGTKYWVKVYSASGTQDNHWEIGCGDINTMVYTYVSADGSSWGQHSRELYYRLTDADTSEEVKIFKYLQATYCVVNSSTPKLYILGDRGVAVSNTGSLNKLIDSSKSWEVNAWAGCVVKIIDGKGADEEIPYRTIVSNTSTELVVSPSWKIEHDTTTNYVILGSNVWTEITGHGLTARVTDVKEINGMCYFCQGDTANIRRWRWYNNSGAATNQFADDGTNKAVFIEQVRNVEIWKATHTVISVASAPTTWTDMTFTNVATFNDSKGYITNIIEYDDKCFIFREGAMYAASAYSGTAVIDKAPLNEMAAKSSTYNGFSVTTANQYLYFSYGKTVNKYYSGNMDDISYNNYDGLPSEYNGYCSHLTAIPGGLIAAIDGMSDKYSSIMIYNNTGWHNLYIAPAVGMRIQNMLVENIDGLECRLYFTLNNDVIYMKLPYMVSKPLQDENFEYCHDGYIITGYMYSSMMDAYKIYRSVKLFTENLEEDNIYIEVDYQLDGDTNWHMIDEQYVVSPMEEHAISEMQGVNGKRIRLRIRFHTNDENITPIMKACVVESIIVSDIKYSYTFNYRNKQGDKNLLGEIEDISAEDKQDIIDYWAENLVPLYMRANKERFDKKYVFASPTTSSVSAANEDNYIENILLIER